MFDTIGSLVMIKNVALGTIRKFLILLTYKSTPVGLLVPFHGPKDNFYAHGIDACC